MRTKLTFDKLHYLHRVQNSGDFTAQSPLQPHYNHHAPPPPTAAPTTVWKSPVPYLFGGLAAMMGLIAFALLILACSYLKLSGNFDSAGENGSGDGGDEKSAAAEKAAATVVANSILVIMAGEETPTFLATPVTTVRPMTVGGGGGGGVGNPNCSCSSSVAESEFKS